MAEESTTTATAGDADENEPFKTRRWNSRTVHVFAAMDTLPQIAERVLAVVGEGRVMNKIATYVHSGGLEDLSRLDHATGLKKGGHAGHPEGHHVWQRDDQAGFSVYLTHEHGTLGTMEGFGVGVLRHNAATEAQVRARYEKANGSDSVFGRRDITHLEIHGRPGEPHRDDRLEVMDWNEHGVLRHTIVTFVEPDYCDSGRIEETHYVVLGHRKDPARKPFTVREEAAEELARFTPDAHNDAGSNGDDVALRAAREALKTVQGRDDIDFAWVAKEKVTRERRSIY